MLATVTHNENVEAMETGIETSERVRDWAQMILKPAVSRYVESGETQFSIPALRRSAVIPTDILIVDAVERYAALHEGATPQVVVLHPLRLLSVAGKPWNLYVVGSHIVALCTRDGLEVDEVYGTRSVVTQPIPRIEV